MSTLQRLTDRGLARPPRWLPGNVQYETIMGSVAYGVSSDSSDVDVYGWAIPPKEDIFPHLRGEIVGFGKQAKRFEQYRLPKSAVARRELAETIGGDGHRLLAAAWSADAPAGLTRLPALETLHRAWVSQFYLDVEGRVTLRDRGELAPVDTRFDSPYDTAARFGTKRNTTWSGYKAHLTESCDDDLPDVIVHVETTPANVADIHLTARVHDAIAAKELAPAIHLVDAGYVDGN